MRNTRSLIAGAIFAALGATAGAQQALPDPTAHAAPTMALTRAQVRAETLAAMAAGQISSGELGLPQTKTPWVSSANRAAVHADAVAAVASGNIPHGEAAPDYPRAIASTTTRAEVRAETLEAVRLGLTQPAGEMGPRQATAAENEAIRAAGLRVRAQHATLAAR